MASKSFKKVSVVKLSADFREATKVVDVPLKPPSDDQVLVRNLYAGVNATDINISAGRYFTDGKVPFDIGLEALGIVESIGKNVTTAKVGQPTMVFCAVPRGFTEYIYAKPEDLIPIPEVKPDYLNLLTCGLTATIGLDFKGQIKSGEKVLITAAAGGTGHIGVQWAKLKGCHVIGTCSSKDKTELLKSLGCDRVINYKEESIDEVLSREYPNGIDVVWETIGGSVYETLFSHLAEKGRLIIVGGITGYKTEGIPDTKIKNLPATILTKSLSLTGFLLTLYKDQFAEYLKKLIELVHTKKITIVLDSGENAPEGPFVGIDSVVRGVEHLHKGQNSGKVIIKIQDK